MLFQFECSEGHSFETITLNRDITHHPCPDCHKMGRKIVSVVNSTFGWRLDDKSHIKGNRDKLERRI